MPRLRTLALSALVVLFVVVWPIVEYRNVYAFNKRLREVTPGRVYRCGEMNAAGFADAVGASRFAPSSTSKTITPIPTSPSVSGIGTPSRKCAVQRLGVRYVLIKPDLIPRRLTPMESPGGGG